MGSTLDGVTTGCVLFLFTCLVIPSFIKNRTQYYAAFGAILGIILMNTLALMLHNSASFQVFGGVVVGFLQIVAVAMLVLCAGGMTVKSLAGEMTHAYEVIRRGEEEKEIIVPLSGGARRPGMPIHPRHGSTSTRRRFRQRQRNLPSRLVRAFRWNERECSCFEMPCRKGPADICSRRRQRLPLSVCRSRL